MFFNTDHSDLLSTRHHKQRGQMNDLTADQEKWSYKSCPSSRMVYSQHRRAQSTTSMGGMRGHWSKGHMALHSKFLKPLKEISSVTTQELPDTWHRTCGRAGVTSLVSRRDAQDQHCLPPPPPSAVLYMVTLQSEHRQVRVRRIQNIAQAKSQQETICSPVPWTCPVSPQISL